MKRPVAMALLALWGADGAAAPDQAQSLGDPPAKRSDPRAQRADALAGRAVFLDRERGHCLLCHRVAQLDEPFQGNLGPDLSNVGARLDPARLRERIVDPTRLNPQTVMPAYHRTENLRQVSREHVGRPILTAREVEDVVAFVSGLRHAGGATDE